MSCAIERARLRLYLEGKLDAAEAAGVEAHLEACASCQSLALVPPEVVQLLRAKLPAVQAPAALREGLLHGLDTEGRDIVPAPVPLPWWRRAAASAWTPRLAMAALLLFLLLVPARSLLRAPAMAQEAVKRHEAHAPFCGRELPRCCHDLELRPGAVLAAPSAGESVPDLGAVGLELIVTSRCDGLTPVNLLCYRNRAGELFSLYITDQVAEQFLHQRRWGGRHSVQSHDVALWRHHGYAYIWVGQRGSRNDTDRALALLRPQ